TVIFLLNGPAVAALNSAVILSSLPCWIAPSGFTGVVQPQPGMADSIMTGLSLILANTKSCLTGVPCLIFPQSYVVSLNFTTSSAFFCCAGWANTPIDRAIALANRNNFFMLINLFVLVIVQKHCPAPRWPESYTLPPRWSEASSYWYCKQR